MHEPRRGGDVATALPRAQERVRIDRRPVARMDLEVQVRWRLLRVARAPHEADHLAGLHAEAVVIVGRERRQVGVEERVAPI